MPIYKIYMICDHVFANGEKCNDKSCPHWDKHEKKYMCDKECACKPCRPLKIKVAKKPVSNPSYTAALREKCRKYFHGADSVAVNNFIKSVQRLNASRLKHCV